MSEKDPQKEVINLLQKIVDQTKPKPPLEKNISSEHKHSTNVQFECPECEKLYVEEKKKGILAEQRAKVKKMESPERCDGCGDVYDKEETEECPTCHGSNEE